MLAEAKKRGFYAGMFLMPVVPFLSDAPEAIEAAVGQAASCKLDYVIFSGMTLKAGRQRDYFLSRITSRYPELQEEYERLYSASSQYGEPPAEYNRRLNGFFREACRKYRLAVRIPAQAFRDIIAADDYARCLISHIDYMLRLRGRKSGLGYAAYVLEKDGRPLTEILHLSRPPAGVNGYAMKLVREIMNTGTAGDYNKLISFEEE
jgi:hypothetical protein